MRGGVRCQRRGLMKKLHQQISPAKDPSFVCLNWLFSLHASTSSIYFYFLTLLLYVPHSTGLTRCPFLALLSGAAASSLCLSSSTRRSSALAPSDSWCCFYWWRLRYKLDCAPGSEFSLIYGILPLFTHSKGSYCLNSLQPVPLTPKHTLAELFVGRAALEKKLMTFKNAPACRNKPILTSFKKMCPSFCVSVLSNANLSAFMSCTDPDQALVTGCTTIKQANNLVTS